MKKYLYVFMSCMLAVLMVGCGGKTSNSSSKAATEDSHMGTTEQDKSKWIYQDNNGMQSYGMLSENYYVIEGRKIALFYQFFYWPNSPYDEQKYSVCFTFIDQTNGVDGAKIAPSFDTVNNKELSIIWNGGNGGALTMSKLMPTNIVTFNPLSYKFQTVLNQKKSFKVNVATASGQSLQYNFDMSQRGALNI
ncbi:hypothetical protein [Phocaeicola sartorii]|uniref:hypothetical protein n=1 Tax=Phocaeicola sartorii TaxID=671267 RepID=UPI001F59C51B|nr:hypothetical protein [Phocaeicola sartorii]